MIEKTALGAAVLAGIAGGVWNDAAEFIGTRQFTRFTPAMPRESAGELMAGWQRAMRATLFWARDNVDAEAAKKKKKRRTSAAKKKVSAKPKSSAKGRSIAGSGRSAGAPKPARGRSK